MIQALSLTKRYGDLTAIDEASFEIKPGEVVGLLGPNGAGKTTTLRLLTGFMPPTSGQGIVAGHDMLEEPFEAKKNIGYLPETPSLYPELTVEESLHFVAGLYSIDKKSRREKVDKALERAGIQDVRKRLVGHVSKGYRQRVGIAQAIIHEPPFLIFDEPTVGLDPKQIIEIRELLNGFKGEHAILLSSHILQEVSMVCDRVIIVRRGKIVADGKIADLTGSIEKKKLLVTVAHGHEKLKADIQKLEGVESVVEYASDLEELFLQLTKA